MNNAGVRSIDDVLTHLRHRRRALTTAEFALRGVAYGGVLAALVMAAGLLLGAAWMQASPWRVLWIVPLTTGLSALIGFIRRVDYLPVARALDLAASGEDRFASALQLGGHHRRERAQLIVDDALARVANVSIKSALPLRPPRELKILPIVAVALAVLLWLAPGKPSSASPLPPEVTAEQWNELHEEFRKSLDDLARPRNEEERDLQRKLERLADLLKQRPDKKEVLEQIARLKSELEKKRAASPGRSASMRQAAAGVKSSSALKSFAAQLQRGNYRKAADALKELADQVRRNAQAMSAEDFEATAADFDRMASELSSSKEMGHACKNCAGAAGSMNRDKLADALDKFSKTLRENADELEKCDKLCKSCNALDDLKRRLTQCKSCSDCKGATCNKPGCSRCNAFVRNSNKKGGSKAGWGTANNWNTGQLSQQKDQRMPVMAQVKQQSGQTHTYTIVSKDEKADSALSYKDVFADMVQKAEGDLALESAPVSYREYLKRYFMAIRPQDDAQPASADK